MRCHARSLTLMNASPGGIITAFCEPPMITSTPQPSRSNFVVPSPVMASTTSSVSVPFSSEATPFTSCRAPVEVSVPCM